MNNFLSSFQSMSRPFTIEEVVLNLVLAALLGMLIVAVYRFTNRHRASNLSFFMTMIILAMVVALVMMVIGNSIARAFSLVGALSIIRFRTVVKDNRDIAYIFFALAAGMSAGVGAYILAIFGVGTILLIMLLLDFVNFGQSPSGLFLVRFQHLASDVEQNIFEPVFKDLLSNWRRISIKTVRMGHFIEHSYLVRLKKGVSSETLITRLGMIEGMEKVSILNEDNEAET